MRGILTLGRLRVTRNRSGAPWPPGGSTVVLPDPSMARMKKLTDPDSEELTALDAGPVRSNSRGWRAELETKRHRSELTRVPNVTVAAQGRPDAVTQTTSTGMRTRSPARARTGEE